MNCLSLLINEHAEGELDGCARRRLKKRGRNKAKVQKCHQIWIAVGLISHCIILSSENHLTELENTHANTLKDLGSFHSDQAMVSHWLLVGTIVFLLAYVSEGSSAPFDCWDATIPTSISYPMSVTFFYQLFQLSFLCSCFPVQVQRNFCAVKRPTAQPKDVRKTASTRRTSVLFPPHWTSCVLPSGLVIGQWRRAGEYGQIKQRRFALVRATWESHPWLMGLWSSQIALLQNQKQHKFLFFLLRRLKSQMSWKKGKKISLGSVSENKRREYNNVQSQLFLSVAAASVKKCRTLKTGKEVWNCGWAAKLDCIREMMASGCWGKVSCEVLKYQCLWTLVSSCSPFPLFFSPVLASYVKN